MIIAILNLQLVRTGSFVPDFYIVRHEYERL